MKQYITKVQDFLDLYFGKKAPQLPDNIKEAIVKYSPYLAIILIVIAVPGLLIALGISAFASPFVYMGGFHYGPTFTLAGLVLLVSLGLEAAAIPGLFKRTKMAWDLMFYSTLINAVYQLVTLNLVGMIISAAISFYFLFQIRSYYK
jgi:hypothetical protein